MKKNYLLCCFSLHFFCAYTQTSNTTVKIFRPDLSFTCITVDSANRIWAGTNGNGFVRVINDKPEQIKIAGFNFGAVNIKHMAADKDKGVWIAHEGYGFTVTLGGVNYVDASTPLKRIHYGSVSRLTNLFKGLPSRRAESIAVDKNDKVWTANSYHELTSPGGNPSNIINPGGMGFKTPSMLTFDTIPTGLDPYPAYTVNTPINLSAGLRVCISVGVDNLHNEVWLGGAFYNALPVSQGSRISRWNLTGTYLGQFDETNSPLPLGSNGNARPIAIYFDNDGNGWVGFNFAKGFAVKTDTGWDYVGLPTLLPAGTNVNPNAIAGNKKGEVFIGTTAGLLKYRGVGSYTSDTSYILYTTDDGLPTNNITGVTVDKGGVVWMATSSGICKMFTADLIMYNLKPTSGSFITESENSRRVVAHFGAGIEEADDIRISADGSKATLFKWQGNNPNNLKLRIKEDPNGNNADEYGSFFLRFRDPLANDSIKVQYTHPRFVDDLYTVSAPGGRVVTLEVVDTTVNPELIVLSEKIRFVLPPVLMLHGVWSDGNAFKEMRDYLLSNGVYKYKDFEVSNPSYTNDVSFGENKDVALYAARDLIEKCANNKMSVGKVDIVAHSMGGILARVFLQNDYYENTIHKLITLNTPHSGSQGANVMMNNPVVFNSLKFINGKIKQIGFDPSRGAAADLQVNSSGILQLLNGPSKNNNITNNKLVPVHAIVTKDESIKNSEIKLWLKATASDALSLAFGKKTPYKTALLVLVKEIAILNTKCSSAELIHTCMKNKLFHDDNDWIVAVKSQEGGLPESAITRFDGIWHIQVESNQNVFFRVHELLRKKDDDDAFTTAGYKPLTLEYDGLLNRSSSISAESIHIANPIAGTVFTAGETINIDITGSSNIKNLMYLAGNASVGISLEDTTLQNHVFTYTIPSDAVGRVNIFAIGYDNNGKATADSTFINVALPGGVSLDSIRVSDRDNLKVFQGDSIPLRIKGFYSDTARDISVIDSITYSFQELKAAASSPNYIKGITPGYEVVVLTYNGKSDTIYIEVIEKPAGAPVVLPITLSSFTGKFERNIVQLNWTTAQELNNHHFEIERSSDGIHFENIGEVRAKTFASGNIYTFNDLSFKQGSNFYRIRQVDIDGHFTFTDIVLIKVTGDKISSLIIYPNPAKNNFTISLGKNMSSDWQINIYSTMGQLISAKHMFRNQQQASFNISYLPKGIYHIVLREKNGTFINSGKIVKQ
ncbi:MAG: T9SS type A sorting domain-containing protein [Ginsengibacter sp.]